MMFLRAFEQGESVYLSLASWGFSDKSNLYNESNRKFGSNEFVLISTTIILIVCLQILAMFFFSQLGIIGINIVK
jgi:cobalt/nickel transport system permease protein